MIKAFVLGALRLYQRTLSRVLPDTCRFVPSCSEYAVEAVEKHGVLRGGWLALRRIARCNPLFAGGEDPVPPAEGKENRICEGQRGRDV